MTPRLSGALTLLAALAATPTVAQPPDRATLEKRLTDLLRERAEELRKESAARMEELRAGRGSTEALLESLRNLRQAETDLTDDPKQRSAALERLVNDLRDIETRVKALADKGVSPGADHQTARAERARAEAGLVEEQLRAAGADKAKLSARLDELRRERLAALRIALKEREDEFKAGRGTLESAAGLPLIQAEIELAADPRQRRQAQERLVRALQDIEQLNQARFDAGRIPLPDLLRARAARLEAEMAVSSDRVAQLRQELVTVRRQEVEARTEVFRAGRGSLDHVLQAQVGLARAELALSEDPRRRIAVQERAVKALRDLERTNRERYEAGRLGAQDLSQTKAARLTAEIELARLQLEALGK